jgi:TolA-binding protein
MAMSLLKYTCLATLSVLVCFLVHVNYLLLRQLGGDTVTSLLPNAMTESMMKVKEEPISIDVASQERVLHLRREVSTMKNEIHRLKGVLETLKQQQQQDDEGGGDDEAEDDEEAEEDDDAASGDDGELSTDGKPLSHR